MDKNEILPTLIEIKDEVCLRNRILSAQNEMPRLISQYKTLANQNYVSELYAIERELLSRREYLEDEAEDQSIVTENETQLEK